MNQYSFEFPYAFLLIFLFAICHKFCSAKSVAIYMPYVHFLLGNKKIKTRWIKIFKWLGIIALITALASPVKIEKINNTTQDARDIMIILDSSDSMKARGYDEDNLKKDKFSAVKEVILDFIKNRKNDRIGLINFSSSAFIASPLTFDRDFLKDIIKRQEVGIVGKRTAIYDALLQGLYLLENSDTKTKIAILITDGADNMSETKYSDILKVLKRSNIKLYIIGIQTQEDEDLDIPKLKKLANDGKGKFFLATNKDALTIIYNEIEKSETTKIKDKSYTIYTYYYYFPLIFAIIFLLIFIYFKSSKGVSK